MYNLSILILAAGKSSRFPGNKIFTPLLGKPIIEFSIDKALKLAPEQTFLLLSPDNKDQEAMLKDKYPTLNVIYQENINGTGGAVECAIPHFPDNMTNLLILFGDTPFISENSLKNIIESKTNISTNIECNSSEFLTTKYGKILLDENQSIKEIIEYKEIEKYTQCKSNLALAGAIHLTVSKNQLINALAKIPTQLHGEKYLTDIFKIIETKTYTLNKEETLGINNIHDFQKATRILHNSLINQHMENKVFFHDTDSIKIQHDTQIEPYAEIHPYVVFGPKVQIKSTAKILPFTYITESTIAGQAGPFTHIRQGTESAAGSELGAFVETKNTIIETKAKAKHHSYLGDMHIGTETNIGAGVISCNYNKSKKQKAKVHIGKNCDIGANSCLIAPLIVNNNAQIGAGSVITKEVPENTLAVTRNQQKNLKKFTKN